MRSGLLLTSIWLICMTGNVIDLVLHLEHFAFKQEDVIETMDRKCVFSKLYLTAWPITLDALK